MDNGSQNKAAIESPMTLVSTQLERVAAMHDDAHKHAEAIGMNHREACQRRDELQAIREDLVALRDRLRGMNTESDPMPQTITIGSERTYR